MPSTLEQKNGCEKVRTSRENVWGWALPISHPVPGDQFCGWCAPEPLSRLCGGRWSQGGTMQISSYFFSHPNAFILNKKHPNKWRINDERKWMLQLCHFIQVECQVGTNGANTKRNNTGLVMFSIMVQPLGGLTPPYLMTLFTFDVPLPQQKVDISMQVIKMLLRRTEHT